MNFEYSDKVKDYQKRVIRFMDEHVYPNEEAVKKEIEDLGESHADSPIMKDLQDKARGEDLWVLFLPDEEHGAGLNNLEYAPLCEIMGRCMIAPRVFNCSARKSQ